MMNRFREEMTGLPVMSQETCCITSQRSCLTTEASNVKVRKTALASIVDESGNPDLGEIYKITGSFPVNLFDAIADLDPEQPMHWKPLELDIRQARKNERHVQTGESQTVCCVIVQHYNDKNEVINREYIPIATVFKDELVNVSAYDVEFSPCRSTDGSLFIRPTIIVDDPLLEFLPSLAASIGGEVIDAIDHDIIDELSSLHDEHHGNTPSGESTYQHIRPLSI